MVGGILDPNGKSISPSLKLVEKTCNVNDSLYANASVETYGAQFFKMIAKSGTSDVGTYLVTDANNNDFIYTDTWLNDDESIQFSDVNSRSPLKQGSLWLMFGWSGGGKIISVTNTSNGPNNFKIYISPTKDPNPPWKKVN